MDAFLRGLVAGYGIAIPVGAIAVLIVQTGMRCGFRCAGSAGAGAATADLLYAVLAVAGGVALSGAVASVQAPLRWGSTVLLVAIATHGLARARRSSADAEDVSGLSTPPRGWSGSTYLRFLGLTLGNPLTIVYFAAVVVGAGVAGRLSVVGAVAFVLGAFLASLSWQWGLAALGSLARRGLPARARRTLTTAGHLVVLAMAVAIAPI